jgi:hypothetical protein
MIDLDRMPYHQRYRLAMAAGWDAGNASAAEHDDGNWTEQDWNVAVAAFNLIIGEAKEI